MTAAKKKAKLSPVNQLQGVLVVLESQKAKNPTAELLLAIREMVSDALAVLQEPEAILPAPALGAGNSDVQVQAAAVGQLLRLVGWLRAADREVGQGHGGIGFLWAVRYP